MPVVVYSSDPRTYRRIRVPFTLWGLALIAYGLVIALWPELSARLFVLLFGALALVAGITQLASVVIARRKLEGLAWMPVVAGVIAISVGLLVLSLPDFTSQMFALVGGAISLAWGMSDLVIGWTGREYFPTWRWHMLRGALATGAGVFILTRPIEALIDAAMLVGIWAIVIGVLTLWLSLRAPHRRGAGDFAERD